MSLEKARELVEGIEDLPTLPEVVIEITRLVENPDTTAEDVYRLVSTDLSLSATMLKLVNSAFYGMPKSVTSLEKAIRILGFATVRNIALAAFVFDAFMTGKGKFDYRGFWLHSIATAAACDIMAKRLRVKDIGEYFVYGLLHDLGMVVLMQYFPDGLTRIREQSMQAADVDVPKVEEKEMGCNHGELGAALAERWEFPASLVSVIGSHVSDEMAEGNKREVAIVRCAGNVAHALEIGSSLSFLIPYIGEEVWQAAGISPDQLGGVMDETLREMEHSKAFIDLLYR